MTWIDAAGLRGVRSYRRGEYRHGEDAARSYQDALI
jgi:hypothetical protein